jgi:hypothetical protein
MIAVFKGQTLLSSMIADFDEREGMGKKSVISSTITLFAE